RGLYHPNRSEPALKRKARRSATSLPHLAEREFFALHLSAHCARRPDRAWRVSRDRCLTRTLFEIQRSVRSSVPLIEEPHPNSTAQETTGDGVQVPCEP